MKFRYLANHIISHQLTKAEKFPFLHYNSSKGLLCIVAALKHSCHIWEVAGGHSCVQAPVFLGKMLQGGSQAVPG